METFIYEEKISPKICDGLIKLFNNTHDKKKGEVGFPAVVAAMKKKCTEAYYQPLPYRPQYSESPLRWQKISFTTRSPIPYPSEGIPVGGGTHRVPGAARYH